MQVLSRQRGVSLIEVLVAIVIFSVGVLGLALMQVKGAQFTKEAGSRSNIIVQVRSLIDAMRANPAAATMPIKAANPASPSSSDCPYCYAGTEELVSTCTTDCDLDGAAKRDLIDWVKRVKSAAPSAVGTNAPVATVSWDTSLGMYVITANWSGGAMDGKQAKVSDNLSYTLNYLP
ncbi:methylation [Rhodanobacter fulvus Jip2]|jgi:type IV pilus assembly protein PilV|uniref:Methylation n=1 Tax=Rhodanobacter fulvus Jip2 TaxID=1163408 RepID=I4VMD3_9GAMM|nr:type IV pilus modification protein PilV [Rhodanobacter fulvus]EIL88374.1 methylation [Rhodanobacter fulvus Jip2]